MNNDYYAAQLRARQVAEETGLTLAEIAELPLDEWSRLTHGKTAAQAALEAIGSQVAPQPPAALPDTAFTQQAAPEPQGIDVNSLSMDQYAALRGQLGIGQSRQEGIGILNQSGQSWAEAARQQPGRSGWQNKNVTPAPSLTGRQVAAPAIDNRTRAERFTFPGSAYQG
jgi:hypothetical protein